MRDSLRARTDRALSERVFPGCVIGVLRKGAEPEYICAGRYTYDPDSESVHEKSLYDVASITKSIPTASLASVLVHEGKLMLDEPVVSYLPDFHHDYGATIRDLLLYKVSGTRLSELKTLSVEEVYAHVNQRGFDGPPGERSYSNLPALLMGLIIERVADKTIGQLSQEYFFGPLKMQSTAFYTGLTFPDAVPTERDDWRGLVQGFTHDESAYVLGKSGRASGHAGLFSTASDIMSFIEAILHPKDDMWQAIAQDAEQGLGWQLNQPYFMGAHASERTFGKTGFTGTSILIDRVRDIGLVILSNRTYPRRSENMDSINQLRSAIADIVLGIRA